ncbi:MAG: CbiX/SirB N-terminal domain-containing protein, partial [Myxococcota bacterium]|nr:CbiX/SirB N-terminal domain-containing protein [Myxococcota bacterium]
MTTPAILLVDHGSRVAAANAQLAEIAARVARDAGPDVVVRHAHMELASPSIGDAVAALAALGVSEIVLVPYFLAPGRHATIDIPRLAKEAAARHAGVEVRVAECLGV